MKKNGLRVKDLIKLLSKLKNQDGYLALDVCSDNRYLGISDIQFMNTDGEIKNVDGKDRHYFTEFTYLPKEVSVRQKTIARRVVVK